MREELELSYFPPEFEDLINGEITIEDFLIGLLNDFDDENHKAICQRLIAYHSDAGGAPEVTEFEIEDIEFNPKDLSGSFECGFSIHFHYGCDDFDKERPASIKWQFKIDTANELIHLTGEEQLIRDPDEY